MKNAYLYLIPGLVLAVVAGCASKDAQYQHDPSFSEISSIRHPIAIGLKPTILTNELSSELMRPADALFTLGPGDALDIEIPGVASSRADATVGPDGKIYYSLLPGLDVWGLTLQQARELLEKELGKYLTQPQITLTLRSVGSRYVWVLGRLNRPGGGNVAFHFPGLDRRAGQFAPQFCSAPGTIAAGRF